MHSVSYVFIKYKTSIDKDYTTKLTVQANSIYNKSYNNNKRIKVIIM